MNESISIKEGSIGRRIAPVDKVKINTTGDGESLWVPAERGNTGVLYASENGIYIASEDGYESYSEVVVRVTEESFYGDNDFDHWDYEVPTDFPDLWDSLTLDDFNVDPLAFDDLFNNKDKWDMDIPDLPDKLDFKMKDLKTKKPKKEKITGIDPVSGNEMAVGLDNFGRLTQEIVPTSIGIIQLPSKLLYVDGETIIFSGIVVQAYTADGNVWQGRGYENGIIPYGELFFPVQIAVFDGEAGTKYASSDLVDGRIPTGTSAMISGYDTYSGKKRKDTKEITGGEAICAYGNNKGIVYLCASSQPGSCIETTTAEDVDGGNPSSNTTTHTISKTYVHNEKTVYYVSGSTWYAVISLQDAVLSFPGGGYDFSGMDEGKLAWTMIYGDMTEETEMEVPVQWFRPGDGQMLETSYTIKVKPSGESGGDGGSTQAINYNGTRYVANEDMNAEAHYQSGTVWIRGEAKVWSVPDAVAFGLLKPEEEKDGGSDSGSEHEGGHF